MNFLNNINWKNGQPIDNKERLLILHLFSSGFTSNEIANAINRDKRTVEKWLTKWQNTGEMNHIKPTGRPRVTTPEEDFHIILSSTDNPYASLSTINENLGLGVYKQTIGNRLRDNKLFVE